LIKSEKGFEVFIQSKHGLIGILSKQILTQLQIVRLILRQLQKNLISVCLRKKMTKDQIQCSV